MRLFLGFFLLYFFTSSGGFESGDAVTRWETARSFLNGNAGALPSTPPLNNVVTGRDRKIYGAYGPFQTLLMIPFLAITGQREAPARLLFNLGLIPLIAASTLLLLFHCLLLLGHSPAASRFAVLTVGLTTPLWHYSRNAQEEHLVAFALVLWLWAMLRFSQNQPKGLVIAALAGAMAITTRWAAFATLFPLAAVTLFLFLQRRPKARAAMLVALMICLAAVGGLLFWNWFRFGSPWETGYRLALAERGLPVLTSDDFLLKGLALLFSPYRGLFWYSPALLLVVPLLRRLSFWEAVGVTALFFTLVMNAAYSFWAGGQSWGPRFLVAPLVLLAPLFARFADTVKFSWLARLVIALSFLVQLASVMVPAGVEDVWRDQNQIAHLDVKNAWLFRATPFALRPSLVLSAVTHTVTGQCDSRVERGCEPIFWWPFRFALTFHRLPHFVAWAFAVLGLSSALGLLLSNRDKVRHNSLTPLK